MKSNFIFLPFILQAVKNAYDLLSEDGLFFAEEIYLDKMHDKDTTWFFDRLDLLVSAGCMKPVEEASEGHHAARLAKMLDTSLPVSQRWIRPAHHGEGHSHDHGEGHKHGHGESHGHQHHHSEGHGHQEPKDEIVGSSAVVNAITAQFGKEKMTLDEVPYFYQLLTYCG